MSSAGTFLRGAQDRLLPPFIPFGFFSAAALFHLIGWGLFLLDPGGVVGFTGGVGLPLAALHSLTLGVLVMTAIGASYQFLPVTTRQPLRRTWAATLSFWLFAPGTALLVLGMALADETALYAGGALAGTGLLVFAILMGDNLRRAASLPLVASHGWVAFVALPVFVLLGFLLIADFGYGFFADHRALARIHMTLALFGFMGILVTGFSRILIPMFALSRSVPDGPGWIHLALGLLAGTVFVGGIGAHVQPLETAGAALALVAASIYLMQMLRTLRARMRKRLEWPLWLIIASWCFLALGMVAGFLVTLGWMPGSGATLFGVLVLMGWQLSFLLGVLARIMPFLASMHAARRDGLPPLLSDLTPDLPLKIIIVLHPPAVVFSALGIVLEMPEIARAGAAVGFVSALAFGVFTGIVVSRIAVRNPGP